MTLEEILAQIESDDLKEAIVGKIEEEKMRGKEASKKKDRDNLKLKADLKSLGWDKDKFETIDEFRESLEAKDKANNTNKLTIAQLNDKLDALESTLATERAEAELVKTRAKETKITSELTKHMGDSFFGASYLIKSLISDGRVDIDEVSDRIYFKDGDEVIDFEKGLAKLKEDNKDMLKVSQQSGTGDVGGSGVDNITENLLDKPTDDILNELGL